MPATNPNPAMRMTASQRLRIGTRAIASMVANTATGGHPAMIWSMSRWWACRTLAARLALMPSARVPRTAHRTRRSCRSSVSTVSSLPCRLGRWSALCGRPRPVGLCGVAAHRSGCPGAVLQVGDELVGQGEGVGAGFGVDLTEAAGQCPAQRTDGIDVTEAGVEPHGLLGEGFVVGVVAERGLQHRRRPGRVAAGQFADQGEVRVDGLLAHRLPVRLDPLVRLALGEGPGVAGGGL